MPTAAEITSHLDDAPPPGMSPWVGGARSRRGVEVVAPDPSWPEVYAGLARLIQDALGSAVVHVEHVGSTSVPGLHAKPVIDIDLTVADSSDEAQWLPGLEAVGFEITVREPWWHEHRCLVLDAPRANLHVFSPGCPETIRHRIFRDWLIGNPEDLILYRDAKLAAAAQASAADEDVMEYNARKQAVVHEIYDRAFRAAGLL